MTGKYEIDYSEVMNRPIQELWDFCEKRIDHLHMAQSMTVDYFKYTRALAEVALAVFDYGEELAYEKRKREREDAKS